MKKLKLGALAVFAIAVTAGLVYKNLPQRGQHIPTDLRDAVADNSGFDTNLKGAENTPVPGSSAPEKLVGAGQEDSSFFEGVTKKFHNSTTCEIFVVHRQLAKHMDLVEQVLDGKMDFQKYIYTYNYELYDQYQKALSSCSSYNKPLVYIPGLSRLKDWNEMRANELDHIALYKTGKITSDDSVSLSMAAMFRRQDDREYRRGLDPDPDGYKEITKWDFCANEVMRRSNDEIYGALRGRAMGGVVNPDYSWNKRLREQAIKECLFSKK